MSQSLVSQPLTFATYFPLARRTLKELPYKAHRQHMALGFCGELGELLDAIKKHAIYGKPLDKVNLAEEIGDVSWYVVNLVPELGFQPALLDQWVAEFKPGKEGKDLDDVDFMLAMNLSAALVAAPLVDDLKPASPMALDILRGLTELLCEIAHRFEIPLAGIFEANILKLQKRYGDKYSDFAALNRDLGAERSVLEGSALGQATAR